MSGVHRVHVMVIAFFPNFGIYSFMEVLDAVPLTESDLRQAIGDPRDWQVGNPDRAGFVQWVTEGYQALHGPEARGGIVHVRAYRRTRAGKVEQVPAHTRAAPPAAGTDVHTGGPAANGNDAGAAVIPAQALLWMPRPSLLYQRPPVLPHLPMRRVPNRSGRDAATDVPSFARGATRFVDETPTQFARRIMDNHWGAGRWRGITEREAEFRKIQKFGQRGFEMPAIFSPTLDNDIL